MAHKMKRTLTRAEQEKLRKENIERAKGMKEVREKCGKKQVEKEASKEKKKEGVTGRIKREICALREIQKYQSGTELFIQWLPFQRVVKEIIQNIRGGLWFQTTALMAIQDTGEGFLVGLLEQANICALHAKHVTIMSRDIQLVTHLGGYLITSGAKENNECKKKKMNR